MSNRSAAILGACLIVCCLILGHFFGPASHADQGRPATDQPIGRYQLVAEPGMLTAMDTATGQCWRRPYGNYAGNDVAWKKFGPPLQAKDK